MSTEEKYDDNISISDLDRLAKLAVEMGKLNPGDIGEFGAEMYAKFCCEYRIEICGFGPPTFQNCPPLLGLAKYIEYRLRGGFIKGYQVNTGFALLKFKGLMSSEDCQKVLNRLFEEGVLEYKPKVEMFMSAFGDPIMYVP